MQNYLQQNVASITEKQQESQQKLNGGSLDLHIDIFNIGPSVQFLLSFFCITSLTSQKVE